MATIHYTTLTLILMAGFAGAETLTESIRFLEFPATLPGTVLKVQKDLDPVTGRIRLISNQPNVSDAGDLLALEAAEQAARRSRLGNLDERLFDRLPALGLLGRIKVAIRVKKQDHVFLDKTRHSLEEQIANSRAYLAAGPVVPPAAVAALSGLVPLEFVGDDIVLVNALGAQLEGLKNNPNIASVWEVVEEAPASELTTLASSGYNPGPVPSGTGAGVKAATFESGLSSGHLDCIGVEPAHWDYLVGGFSDVQKRHTQAVFRTLVATAPGATFYHRGSTSFSGSADIAYLVNNGIQTVSLSRSRGESSPYRATHGEFLTMDNMAYAYPYTVFANPTFNLGYGYEVNWQTYNALSVGNVRHTNGTTFEMADCTQAKNPPPRYGSCISGSGADCAGDREMPHLLAPGFPTSGSTFSTTCLEGAGNVTCGTSLSAPVANGAAAAVIGADSRLASWPEKVRATLILTAQNVESGDWTVSGDERDGTGVISVADAVAFAQGHTTVVTGNSAVVSGMSANSFYASDFSANKRFYFQVPNPKPSGKHLRTVLTWDSNPVVSSGINALSDLDLVVQHNGGTTTSSSWDSNVEVVDIPAANLTAGSSYYIDLAPYTNRIPSGVNYFYYALAWTWVKDHAP